MPIKLLSHNAIANWPSADTAILHDGRVISYGTLNAFANGAADWLRTAGVRFGDVVALSLSDAVLQICFTLGLMQIGACQSTLDPLLRPAEFRNLTRRLGVSYIISNVPHQLTAGATTLVAPIFDLLRPKASPVEPERPITEEDIVLKFQGSGTTGHPKIMALRHRMLLARLRNSAEDFATAPSERTMILHRHTSLTYMTRTLTCLYHGNTVVEVSEMRAPTQRYWAPFADALDRDAVAHVHCTVIHAKALAEEIGPRSDGPRFPELRSFIVGASPVGDALRTRIAKRISPNLCINYGTNEAGSITRATPTFLARYPGTVGTVAPLTEIAIISAQREPRGSEKPGMIAVRGPCVIDGYEGDPEATSRAFQGGWFITGDIGHVNAAGAVHLLGRADDMMIIDGVNIYPAEIERVIEQLPGVKEVAVTALYSELGQDRIVAFVVREGPLAATAVAETCRRALGWKAPKNVFFIKSLPRNAAGKVLRRELRKFLKQQPR